MFLEGYIFHIKFMATKIGPFYPNFGLHPSGDTSGELFQLEISAPYWLADRWKMWHSQTTEQGALWSGWEIESSPIGVHLLSNI